MQLLYTTANNSAPDHATVDVYVSKDVVGSSVTVPSPVASTKPTQVEYKDNHSNQVEIDSNCGRIVCKAKVKSMDILLSAGHVGSTSCATLLASRHLNVMYQLMRDMEKQNKLLVENNAWSSLVSTLLSTMVQVPTPLPTHDSNLLQSGMEALVANHHGQFSTKHSPSVVASTKSHSKKKLITHKQSVDLTSQVSFGNPLLKSSQTTRIISEQLAIVSVAEANVQLAKYQTQMETKPKTPTMTSRMRNTSSSGRKLQSKPYSHGFVLEDFEYPASPMQQQDSPRRVLPNDERKPQTLVPPVLSARKRDRKVIPTLSASRKDQPTSSIRRRGRTTKNASEPLGSIQESTKSPPPERPNMSAVASEFFHPPSASPSSFSEMQHFLPSDPPLLRTSQSLGNSTMEESSSSFDPLAVPHVQSHDLVSLSSLSNVTSFDNTAAASVASSSLTGVSILKQQEQHHVLEETPKQEERLRTVVRINLSEDLLCSYKHSKLSSCAVEGVVQIQVKCEDDPTLRVPFLLSLRDPCQYVKAIQENSKYAKDLTSSKTAEEDYKFIVTLPSSGTNGYSPVVRYKCGSQLRPVPIRVQTRVRLHPSHCRVALQISSNPANEADLVDLTIIMGVPDKQIVGETLTTIPPGGVWNPSKRSVIWCVAELGEGEKFQLQAQFQTSRSYSEGDKPKFPVLVKCHCKSAHLSELEATVSDTPDVFPVDLKMKLSHSFRLSHQEK